MHTTTKEIIGGLVGLVLGAAVVLAFPPQPDKPTNQYDVEVAKIQAQAKLDLDHQGQLASKQTQEQERKLKCVLDLKNNMGSTFAENHPQDFLNLTASTCK